MGPVESRSLAIWGMEGMKVPETKTNIRSVSQYSQTQLEIYWVYVRGIRPVRDTITKIPLFFAGEKRS